MPYAIRIHRHGGPEVLRWEEVEVRDPAAGELHLKQSAIGVNFIDIYERTGLYKQSLPTVLGHEAAGVVTALGPKVKGFAIGDRVAYAINQPGAYAEERILAANRAVRIPDDVSDQLAAAAMLKGLTAVVLLRRTYKVKRNDVVMIHAAAGGVGLLAVQIAKHLGAKVIAVVGSEQKAGLASGAGADHVLVGIHDLAQRVRQFASEGVHAVYDSVGKDTFLASLDCLRPLGMMVTYGNSSGPPPAVEPIELSRRGSLYLTRPGVFHYTAKRSDLEAAAKELFMLIGRSQLRVHVGQTYALRDTAQAHIDLEQRRTVGSSLLLP
jgi:NADPH2:quinone reductase